jgi:DNA-binding NarL/FixJ family response regulator
MLTPREVEIIELMYEGMTAAAIAEKLFISALTVKTHQRNIMAKWQVNNKMLVVRKAIEDGVIQPSRANEPQIGNSCRSLTAPS